MFLDFKKLALSNRLCVSPLFALLWTVRIVALLLILNTPCKAAVTVFLSEPFGRFGTMMPVGHAGVYLDHVCSDSPVRLRLCRPGELGVVLSRYHRVANVDWLAIPLIPFLYGVDRPEDVPRFMTLQLEAEIRERYRLGYLRSIVPDGPSERPAPKGEWVETIGVTFDRRVWAYRIDTTVDQDKRVVEILNDRPNVRAYRLRTANCANFAGDVINMLYPGIMHLDKIADFGLTTPKQVARSVVEYSNVHPEVNLTVWEIPQVPGTLSRSRPIRGVAEAGLKTKRYLVSLLIVQPEVILGCGIAYLDHGRWAVGQGASQATPYTWSSDAIANTALITDPAESDYANEIGAAKAPE